MFLKVVWEVSVLYDPIHWYVSESACRYSTARKIAQMVHTIAYNTAS
jgi:hypothetical protein